MPRIKRGPTNLDDLRDMARHSGDYQPTTLGEKLLILCEEVTELYEQLEKLKASKLRSKTTLSYLVGMLKKMESERDLAEAELYELRQRKNDSAKN